MFVIFEGIDTCGKSTQIELIKKKIPELVTTKEPGGTEFGRKAREILLHDRLASERAELLLFLADRAEHYEEVIKPNRDKVIISDRGFISGIGYARASGSFDFETLMRLNRFAMQDTLPDRIVLFLIDRETLRERSSQKSLDGIEERGLEYLLRVQEYMRESVISTGIPHLFIDAADSIESINETILEYLRTTQ